MENKQRYDVISHKGDAYKKIYENLDIDTVSELVQIHRAQNTDKRRTFHLTSHSKEVTKKPRLEFDAESE